MRDTILGRAYADNKTIQQILSEIMAEGCEAYLVSVDRCPYPKGSELYCCWRRGYVNGRLGTLFNEKNNADSDADFS